LAKNVQVRKESWGLLFYSQDSHRLLFVKSGNWLAPENLKEGCDLDSLIDKAVQRIGCSSQVAIEVLTKLINNLSKNGMIVNELC